MYLEKLEIQGFKSFANPTELVFNRDLTAIVGPNGSGKSNVADAVRWVLGEQSSKTLRSKKAEDVIFSGSDKKGRLGFAQVDLYLNNSDKSADVDYDQIIITRKIDRKGESEYLINNNKVRLLDIQLLLAKANFGQKTYSVIGQGMIDSILTSSAQERKEFFDEATGVKQFQIKKNQAINKLDGTKKNLDQTGQILAELTPRLRSLTRQVNKLDRREKIETELNELQTNYYSFISNNLNKDLKEKQINFDKLQAEVSELNQQLVELQTKLEKEEKSSSRQENFELLQGKLSQTQSELNALLKEKTILDGQADLKLMSSGKGDIVWLKKRIDDIKNTVSKHTLILEEKRTHLKAAKEELDILEDKRNKILDEFKQLEDRLMGSNGSSLSTEELSDKIKNIFEQQKSFQDSLNSLANIDDLSGLKQASQGITDAISRLWGRVKKPKEDDRQRWQIEFNKLLTSKDTLVSEISEARTKLALSENDISKLEEQVQENKAELEKLELEKQASLDQSGNSDSLKKQMEALQNKVEVKNEELAKAEGAIKSFNEQEEGKKKSLVDTQKNFREIQADFNYKNNKLNEVKVELARLETRQEELDKEIAEEFPELEIKDIESVDLEKSRQQINNLRGQLSVIGGIDKTVVEEYKEVSERHEFLSEQTEDLEQAITHLEKIIKDLDESISAQFDKSFSNINKTFHEYFKKLFSGGKAELILDIQEVKLYKNNTADEEEDDKEVEVKKQYGIEIKATPPGKKLSSINMLSGGEKAMTSIALICAIIANNPSPFVVLDEVDAALDEANSIRFVDIIDELSSKTQFIAITHNRATMHKAKIIYGVTMGDDSVSKLLSLSFDEADEIAA
ncbi:AAA family ATPase [Candidatus Parcubacteria bacterium]|jgi:chromosome segregation protein|nr:AAA family ATPase [Candidatus Parcubacteria bacterium]